MLKRDFANRRVSRTQMSKQESGSGMRLAEELARGKGPGRLWLYAGRPTGREEWVYAPALLLRPELILGCSAG